MASLLCDGSTGERTTADTLLCGGSTYERPISITPDQDHVELEAKADDDRPKRTLASPSGGMASIRSPSEDQSVQPASDGQSVMGYTLGVLESLSPFGRRPVSPHEQDVENVQRDELNEAGYEMLEFLTGTAKLEHQEAQRRCRALEKAQWTCIDAKTGNTLLNAYVLPTPLPPTPVAIVTGTTITNSINATIKAPPLRRRPCHRCPTPKAWQCPSLPASKFNPRFDRKHHSCRWFLVPHHSYVGNPAIEVDNTVLEAVVEGDPHAAGVRNLRERMALHTFLAKISDGQTPADVATLGMIIDAWKRATLALVSVDGEPEETALSLYLNGNSPDAEIVKTMLAKAPETARTKNAAGDYPLVTFLRTIDREPDRDGEEEGLEKHFNLVRQASTAALKGTGEVVNLGAHHVNYAVTGEGTVWLCGGSPPPRPPLRWNTPQTHLDPSRRSR
mmetsp:Transcript_68722/g.191707  ORF Transcript_68722/g.191707 Transcript_68722/m.191707 type:complete len:447 (-) Transcript_68722:2403-3743(-)